MWRGSERGETMRSESATSRQFGRQRDCEVGDRDSRECAETKDLFASPLMTAAKEPISSPFLRLMSSPSPPRNLSSLDLEVYGSPSIERDVCLRGASSAPHSLDAMAKRRGDLEEEALLMVRALHTASSANAPLVLLTQSSRSIRSLTPRSPPLLCHAGRPRCLCRRHELTRG